VTTDYCQHVLSLALEKANQQVITGKFLVTVTYKIVALSLIKIKKQIQYDPHRT